MLEYGSSARWRSPSDGDMVDLPAGKAGLLLAAFVMHANQVVSTDRLFEFRWRGRPPGTAASTLLTGLYQVIGCGVPAVWAHGGDPLVGGSPQIVGGSAVRAGKCPHRLASELLGEVPALAGVTVMGGRGVGAPGAGCGWGTGGVALVFAVPGEEFDGPVEPVAGRASDHGAFEGPAS